MITKENLLVAKIATKKSIKPELGCIAFYGERTVATDSFRAMEVPIKDGEKNEDEPILMLYDTVKIPKGMIGIDEPRGYRVAGKWPDLDQIMNANDDTEYTTLSVNGAMFGELLMQMGKLNRFAQVRIRVPHKTNMAIRLEADCAHLDKSDTRKARGLMMPMNKQ